MRTARIITLGLAATSIMLLAGCGKGEKAPAEAAAKPAAQSNITAYCEITVKDGHKTVQGDCSAAEIAKIPADGSDYHYTSKVIEK